MKQDGQFLLFTRQEFKDWLLKTQFTRQIKTIQQHHTYIPNYKSFNDKNHLDMVKGMKNYHMTSWNPPAKDIAQNLTLYPDGMICVCRSFNMNPAGIYGANTDSLCIENIGNFDIDGDVMSEKHKKTIVFVNAVLCMRFNITPNTNTILYHFWYDLKTGKRKNGSGVTKSCPGTKWFGGNSIESAQKNFIPLIVKEIQNQKVGEVVQVFADMNKVSEWAKDAVQNMEKLKIMNGDSKNCFNPGSEVTREQLAVVMNNLLKVVGRSV